MDSNQQQPAQTPAQPNPSIIQQPQSSGGNKMVLWLILGLVVIVLAGGAYWYFMGQKGNSTPQPTPVSQTAAPESSLDDDLNSIDVQASEGAEFSALDADLQSL